MNRLRNCLVFAVGALAAQAAVFGQSTNRWEKSAALGLSLTAGNSETLLVTGDFRAIKKLTVDTFDLGANFSYGENSSVKNNESVRAFGQWDHLFTERFYSYLRLEGLHDAVADVEYRVTLSPGAGYHFIKNDKMKLSGEAGPAVVFEKQGVEETVYLTARLAEKFEYKFSDRARLWQSLEFLPQVDDVENFLINAEIGVEAALTQKTSLRVYVQDTYDNEPAPGRKKNDIKLVSAVAVKF
jgi:putative salt-induced outer membrane protein YdiY